jgi:GT2 family glycosyltransferase
MVGERGGLSAVIVGYRQPDLACEALRALAEGSRVPDEFVVVDVDPLQPFDPGACEVDVPVRVLATDDNPGYAAACNRGAAETSGSWVLFLNADVAVSADAVAGVLAEAARHPDVGIATCRLVKSDRSTDLACHRGIPTVIDSLAYKLRLDRLAPRSRTLGHYHLTWLDLSESHDVEACCGAFSLVRREALEAVGGWEEGYRFYGEDLDLCARVRQAGWRVRYVGGYTALHHKGAASNLSRDPRDLSAEQRRTRDWVRASVLDAHERFYHEHMEDTTPRLLRPLVGAMFRAQRWRSERERD